MAERSKSLEKNRGAKCMWLKNGLQTEGCRKHGGGEEKSWGKKEKNKNGKKLGERSGEGWRDRVFSEN